MPRIRLSNRKIQPANIPSLRMGGGWNEGLTALSRANHAKLETARMRKAQNDQAFRTMDIALYSLNKMAEAVRRNSDREADEAVTKWEAHMIAGVEGTTDAEGNVTGGIAQKTWRDYEGKDASPITDLRDLEKSFQESDTYKDMSGMARERFENRIRVRRAQYLGAANRMYDKNAKERTKHYDDLADSVSDRRVETVTFEDDATFDQVAREETFRKASRKFRNLMENPDVVDNPNATPYDINWRNEADRAAFEQALVDGNKKFAMDRCEKMAKGAAMGEISIDGENIVLPLDKIEKAEQYADKLASETTTSDHEVLPPRITAEERKSMQYGFDQARSKLDQRINKNIAEQTAAALAEGDVATLERKDAEFARTLADTRHFPEGSSGRTALLVARKSLGDAADKRATYDLMRDMADGMKMEDKDGNPIFNPKTQARYARLYPEVKKAWEEKKYRANRTKSRNDSKATMMKVIESGNPQEYYNYLAQGVMNGTISQQDFMSDTKEFSEIYNKGMPGDNAQRSRKQQMAGKMLDALKEKLGVDFSPVLKKDAYGDISIKNGGLEYVDKAEIPEAVVRKVTGHRETSIGYGFAPGLTYVPEHDETKSFRMSGEEIQSLLGRALSLWSLDGMKIEIDPFTGERLPEGETHTVNAALDFNTILDGIVRDKDIMSAADAMKRHGVYMDTVRAQAVTNENRLRDAMRGKSTYGLSDEEEKD